MYPSLPTLTATLPPFDNSVDLVTIFMVPPTDEIGRGEDPNPLWTCIADTTSVKPAQLLQ